MIGALRGVLAENLIAAMLDLELASGNDAMASHSQIRKSAKLMLQFLPGTDFIFSGYSSMPRQDNLFGGGNFDAEDLDDYNVLQRDMQVDGGLRAVCEPAVLEVRERGARATQAVLNLLGDTTVDPQDPQVRYTTLPPGVINRLGAAGMLLLAINELPEDQRVVFVAHEIDGKSFKEMAAETGTNINTLLSRKRYAVLQLRERLQRAHDELIDT